MSRLGHEVKLIAPHCEKPFVRRQKNDAADAEAIVMAAQWPEMRFVESKATEQQSRTIVFRARERLVHQRTELVNALRACLYEFGHVVPQAIRQLGRIKDILDEPNSDLPELMSDERSDPLKQIAQMMVRIDDRTARQALPKLPCKRGNLGFRSPSRCGRFSIRRKHDRRARRQGRP